MTGASEDAPNVVELVEEAMGPTMIMGIRWLLSDLKRVSMLLAINQAALDSKIRAARSLF
eukprot:gene9029-9200_t